MHKQEKPFAVFDIDGTLIRWQLFGAISDRLAKIGHFSDEDYKKIKSARMDWKNRISPEAFNIYQMQIITLYDSFIHTLPPLKLEEVIEAVIDEYKQQTYTYTSKLITELKAKKYMLFAISGSQHQAVGLLAKHYGFDDYLGTEYSINQGKFTGKYKFHAADKQKALASLVKKHGLSYAGSLAVGDSPSDVPMLAAVDHPIAFNPDASLYETARVRGWKIVIERKNVIYELESSGDKYLLA